jgi:hypothetical protein
MVRFQRRSESDTHYFLHLLLEERNGKNIEIAWNFFYKTEISDTECSLITEFWNTYKRGIGNADDGEKFYKQFKETL